MCRYFRNRKPKPVPLIPVHPHRGLSYLDPFHVCFLSSTVRILASDNMSTFISHSLSPEV